MSWKPVNPTERIPDPTPGVRSTGGALDLATVSEMLSDARTSCSVPHHPSLADWCGECSTGGQPATAGFRPDLLADDDKDRL